MLLERVRTHIQETNTAELASAHPSASWVRSFKVMRLMVEKEESAELEDNGIKFPSFYTIIPGMSVSRDRARPEGFRV